MPGLACGLNVRLAKTEGAGNAANHSRLSARRVCRAPRRRHRARAGLSDQGDQDDRAGGTRRADRCAGAARRRPHGGGARAARHHRQSRRRGRRDRRQGGGSSRPRRLHAAVRQHRDARQYPSDLEKRRLRFGQELRRRRQGDGLLPGPRRQPQPSGEVGRRSSPPMPRPTRASSITAPPDRSTSPISRASSTSSRPGSISWPCISRAARNR